MLSWTPVIAALCFGLGPLEGPWAPLVWLVGLLGWAGTPVGRPLADLGRGALVGVAWYGASLAWFWTTWSGFRSVGDPTLAWAGLTCLQATIPAIGCGLAGWLLARGWPRWAATPVAWVAAESLAGWIQPLPGGLALYMAHVQPLLWPAAWGGVPLWLAVAGATAGATVERRIWAPSAWAIWGTIGLLPTLYAIDGRPVRVGVVQPNPGALEARQPSRAPELARELRAAVDRAGAGADLVVAAEGAWPLDPGPEGSHRRRTFERAWAGAPATVVGATVGDGSAPTNSALVVEGGRVVGRVDKVHLLPLGERVVLGFGSDVFRSGEPGGRVVTAGATRLGVLICYEDLLGPALRDLAGAEVLLTPTNDTWLGSGSGSLAHEAGARLAAVRAARWVVRPALAGRSLVVSPDGRIHLRGPWVDGDDPAAPGPWAALAIVRARAPPWWTGAGAEPALFSLGWLAVVLGTVARFNAWKASLSRRWAGDSRSRY